jgi:hypothetical protein
MKIGSPRDFWAGAMFIAFGSFFALWSVAFYPVGTAVRMGPAYFPALLGALLAVLGGLIMAGSLAREGEPLPTMGWRPLVTITAGCVAYGYLMHPAGLLLATAALVYVSALGGHEFDWREAGWLCLVLVVFSLLVFVKGLALPFPLCPALLDACPLG